MVKNISKISKRARNQGIARNIGNNFIIICEEKNREYDF